MGGHSRRDPARRRMQGIQPRSTVPGRARGRSFHPLVIERRSGSGAFTRRRRRVVQATLRGRRLAIRNLRAVYTCTYTSSSRTWAGMHRARCLRRRTVGPIRELKRARIVRTPCGCSGIPPRLVSTHAQARRRVAYTPRVLENATACTSSADTRDAAAHTPSLGGLTALQAHLLADAQRQIG